MTDNIAYPKALQAVTKNDFRIISESCVGVRQLFTARHSEGSIAFPCLKIQRAGVTAIATNCFWFDCTRPDLYGSVNAGRQVRSNPNVRADMLCARRTWAGCASTSRASLAHYGVDLKQRKEACNEKMLEMRLLRKSGDGYNVTLLFLGDTRQEFEPASHRFTVRQLIHVGHEKSKL